MAAPIRLQIVVDGGGNAVVRGVQDFSNALQKGLSGAGNLDAISLSLKRANSDWQRFGETGYSSLRRIGDYLPKIASGIYILNQAGSLIERGLISPLKQLGATMVEIEEKSRTFEIRMSGIVGGMSQARSFNYGLIASSRKQPYSVDTLRESASAIASTPSLAGRLAAGTTQQQIDATQQYASLIGRLGMIDPQQGEKGAGLGVREVMEGDLISLRRRFGITSQTLARMANKSMTEVKNDPTLALQGLQSYVNLFIPEEDFNRTQTLISVRMAKIKDAVQFGMVKVMDGPLFDNVSGRLSNVGDELWNYILGPDFDGQAQRMSTALDRVLGNLGKSVFTFLRSVTGSKDAQETLSTFFELSTQVVEKLATWSDKLPGVADSVGSLAGEIVNLTAALAGLAKDPAGAVESGVTAMVNKKIANSDINHRLYSLGWSDSAPESSAREKAVLDLAYQVDTIANPQDKKTHSRAQRIHAIDRRLDLGQDLMDSIGNPAMVFDGSGYTTQFKDPAAVAKALAQHDQYIASTLVGRMGAPAAASVLPTSRPAVVSDANYPESVRSLVKGEYTGPAYQVILQSLSSALSKLSTPAAQEGSPLERMTSEGHGVLRKNFGTTTNPIQASNIFDILKSQYSASDTKFAKAIRDGQVQLASDALQRPDFDNSQLKANVFGLDKTRADAAKRYDISRLSASDSLTEAARDYGVSLSQTIKDLPPEARTALRQRIIDGTTDLANQVADLLQKAGMPVADRAKTLGSGNLSLERRQGLLSAQTQDELAARQGTLGLYTNETTSADIIHRQRLYADTLNAQQLGYLTDTAIPKQAGLLDDAAAKYAINPLDDQAIANLRVAQVELGRLVDLQAQLSLETDFTKKTFIEFGASARSSIEEGLGNAIDKLITGTGKLGDVFKSLGLDIVNAFSQMASRNIIYGLVGNLGVPDSKGVPGGLGGLLGGGASALIHALFPGSGGSKPAAPGPTTRPSVASANGNVLRGGFRAFASGGVVTQPTVGLIGEGRYNEAVVPLPDNRSIPVVMHGGDSSSSGPRAQKVFIVQDEAQMFRMGYKANEDLVINTVTKNVRSGGAIGKAAQRGR